MIEAGAFPVGKTNLDQFATGLVGTRSPYGEVKNALDPELISGGSSSVPQSLWHLEWQRSHWEQIPQVPAVYRQH